MRSHSLKCLKTEKIQNPQESGIFQKTPAAYCSITHGMPQEKHSLEQKRVLKNAWKWLEFTVQLTLRKPLLVLRFKYLPSNFLKMCTLFVCGWWGRGRVSVNEYKCPKRPDESIRSPEASHRVPDTKPGPISHPQKPACIKPQCDMKNTYDYLKRLLTSSLSS